MISEKFLGLKDLPDEEKLQLAGELWDGLAERPGSLPQREDHVKLLQERLKHFRQHSEDCGRMGRGEGASPGLPVILPLDLLAGADADLQKIFNRLGDCREGSGGD